MAFEGVVPQVVTKPAIKFDQTWRNRIERAKAMPAWKRFLGFERFTDAENAEACNWNTCAVGRATRFAHLDAFSLAFRDYHIGRAGCDFPRAIREGNVAEAERLLNDIETRVAALVNRG